MAFFDSRVSKFKLTDSASAVKDLSPYLTEVSGLPGPRNLLEVTALSDTGTKSIPGLQDADISLSGIFNDSSTAGPDLVLGVLRTHTAATAFSYGPNGTTAGEVDYSGSCWVSSYEIQSRVGSRVEFTATLKVEGAVTRGTMST